MQDQYGLFLQAKPEERVEVLGTLLGLGIYQSMERIASDNARVNGAKKRELEQEITIHNVTIAEFGKPDEELEACRSELAEQELRLQEKVNERDQKKLILSHQQEAVERRKKALAAVTTLQAKKTVTEQNRATQQAIADSSATILAGKAEIEEKIAERNNLLKRELDLAGQSALYTSEAGSRELCKTGRNRAGICCKPQECIAGLPEYNECHDTGNLPMTEKPNRKRRNTAGRRLNWKPCRRKRSHTRKQRRNSLRLFSTTAKQEQVLTEKSRRQTRRKLVLEKKVAILNESGCVDIENAHCKFLQDAIEAKEKLAMQDTLYADIEARRKAELAKTAAEIEEKKAAMEAIGFDLTALSALQSECATLLPYVSQVEAISQRESQLSLIRAKIEHLKSDISKEENRLAEVKLKGTQAETEQSIYAKSF